MKLTPLEAKLKVLSKRFRRAGGWTKNDIALVRKHGADVFNWGRPRILKSPSIEKRLRYLSEQDPSGFEFYALSSPAVEHSVPRRRTPRSSTTVGKGKRGWIKRDGRWVATR